MNYDYRITDWLKLETKVALDNNKRTDVGSNGAWVIGEAILDMPNHPVYMPMVTSSPKEAGAMP